MKNSEKILIENLFDRLRNMEQTVLDKDEEALQFIKNLLNCQKNSVYYMVQTILIQDTAIRDLKSKIIFLEKRILNNNQSSFLSNSLQQKVLNSDGSSISTASSSNQTNLSDDKKNQSSKRGIVSSFLGNALQTAVGVAGGMFAGNMLTSFLSNAQSENVSDSLHHDSNNYLDHESIKHISEDNVLDQNSLFDQETDQNNFEYLDYDDNDLDLNYD